MTTPTTLLTIQAGRGAYPVRGFPAVDGITGAIARHPSRVVVMDRRVAELYPQLADALGSAPCLLVDATEDEKSLRGVERVLSFVQAADGHRGTVLVAVGGGIVQDVVTIAAHLYYRGLDWVYVPTTLLSMADSCIGSKGAINLNAYKNQIGAFHAPREVLLSLAFTGTLEPRDVRSGYGEILKLHVLGGAQLFDQLRSELEADGFRGEALERQVKASLEVKQRVIEVDEYEGDLRRILNFGHTFGHALEAVTSHAVPHGVAVAWGVDVANFVAVRQGLLPEAEFAAVRGVVDRHFRAPLPAEVSASALVDAMRRDKKAAAGSVNLILLAGIGEPRIVPTPLDRSLEALLDEYLSATPSNATAALESSLP